jgi:hypothetical protein
MAAIETIADGKYTEEIINVGQKVGSGKSNIWSDIIVVQALLLYYKEFADFAPGKMVTPSGRPDGRPSPELNEMIKTFQKHENKFQQTHLTEDGVVSKAKGASHWKPGRKWTIVQLNDACGAAFVMGNRGADLDYISDVRKKYPEVDWALTALPLSF